MSEKMIRIAYGLLVVIAIGAYVAVKGGLLDRGLLLTVIVPAGIGLWVLNHWNSRRFREYQFTPIKPSRYSLAFGRKVKHESRNLDEMGFQVIGDYRLLPEPHGTLGRSLISPDGKCFAEIMHCGEVQMLSFVSTFDDGMYLESAGTEQPATMPQNDVPLRLCFAPVATTREVWEFHKRNVQEYEHESGAKVLALARDDWPKVADYGHRLSGHDQHQQGFKVNAPQAKESPAEQLCDV